MFSICTSSTSPTGRCWVSRYLGRVGRWTSKRLIEVLQVHSRAPWVDSVLWATSALSTFRSRRPKSPWGQKDSEGVAPFLASSISVLLAKCRRQCIMSIMWRKKWEINWTIAPPLWRAGKGAILLKIAQYITISLKITKPYIAILQSKIDSSSSRAVI